jgi:hypothetical protein
MDTAVKVGIISAVVSILSIVITNYLNRRKYAQDLKSGEYDWKSKELKLYKEYDDLKEHTIKDLSKKVGENAIEIAKLRDSIDKGHLESLKLGKYVKELIDMINTYYCCVLTCKTRKGINEEELDKLSGLNSKITSDHEEK